MIDWQKVCSDLRGLFGSLRQVGRLIHHHNPDYLTKLERGEIADPRFSLGSSLIELYKLHVDTLAVTGRARSAKVALTEKLGG